MKSHFSVDINRYNAEKQLRNGRLSFLLVSFGVFHRPQAKQTSSGVSNLLIKKKIHAFFVLWYFCFCFLFCIFFFLFCFYVMFFGFVVFVLAFVFVFLFFCFVLFVFFLTGKSNFFFSAGKKVGFEH